MTTEEYRENLIRMWDSVRNESKGEETCRDVNCRDCHFDEICNAVYGGAIINACKTIEIVEQWAEQHPIVTNADKFKEVFGFDMTICWDNEFPCNECQFCDIDGTCNSKEKFWNAEYKEPAESEDKE